MLLFSIVLLGFALTDLFAGGSDRTRLVRAVAAAGVAAGVCSIVLALCGLSACEVVATSVAIFLATAGWVCLAGVKRATFALGWIGATFAAAFALGGCLSDPNGDAADWYGDLPSSLIETVPFRQFLAAICGVLFLSATANRIVKLILEVAGSDVETAAKRLKGGRFIGPMERWVVFAAVLAGELAGAAIVIAAKSILRIPEVRTSSGDDEATQDDLAEYLLVGTFASLLIAGVVAAATLAAG